MPVAVVLAKQELEAWFLGSLESLRGVRGISPDAAAPEDPESIRGAKEALAKHMTGGRYMEVGDQPALAERMDVEQARTRCPSFDKFLREVDSLVSKLGTEGTP